MNNKPRRIMALIGIILLVGLYITTLLLAIFENEQTHTWFMACIGATIIVPIMLWVYSWLYKRLQKDVSEARQKASDTQDPQENDNPSD